MIRCRPSRSGGRSKLRKACSTLRQSFGASKYLLPHGFAERPIFKVSFADRDAQTPESRLRVNMYDLSLPTMVLRRNRVVCSISHRRNDHER